jgi:hypothetical protein
MNEQLKGVTATVDRRAPDNDVLRNAIELIKKKNAHPVDVCSIRREVRLESAAMTLIPARVIAVGKEDDRHRIVVRIVLTPRTLGGVSITSGPALVRQQRSEILISISFPELTPVGEKIR